MFFKLKNLQYSKYKLFMCSPTLRKQNRGKLNKNKHLECKKKFIEKSYNFFNYKNVHFFKLKTANF